MRYKVLACKALFREISQIAAQIDTVLDVTYLRQELHDTPDILRKTLQNEIDLIDNEADMHTNRLRFGKDFDAILLGYGLCSNGIAGLSSKKYPLVVPRADDCIALFLGSYQKYKEFFDMHPGTYWYNASWIENAYTPSEANQNALIKEYTEKYGYDNAMYILETESTVKNYNMAAYIEWKELNFPSYEQYTKQAAKYYGWQYEKVKGDSGWLKDFLTGNHDQRFVVAMPGKQLTQDYTGKIITTCHYTRSKDDR
ncbi:MAG: DUF1638 domain-containing protein [Christensenellales bacterium]|jgi:hypothetical protein